MRRWQRGALVLLTAALVLEIPRYGGIPLSEQVLKLLVGGLALIWLSRRAELALLVLVVWLPFQTLVLAVLLNKGHVPAAVIRAGGFTKELCVAALVVAAVERGSRRRLDLLDKLALVYVGFVSFYLIVPVIAPGGFFPLPFGARALGWRTHALFVVAFLAARRISFAPAFRRRLVVALVSVGLVGAACALVEFFAPDVWSNFLLHTANLRLFRAVIFGELRAPSDELIHTVVGGRDVIRVGSIALTPLEFGFTLLVPLALLLERLAGSRRRLLVGGASALVAGALLLTLTRSAILGGLLLVLITLRLAAKRQRPGRIQVAVGLLLTLVLVGPFLGSSAVGERFASTFQGDNSATEHQSQSGRAISLILEKPLGIGLGTGPGSGSRYDFTRTVTAEDVYLQIGVEMGILTMVSFVVLTLVMLRDLRRRAVGGGDDAGLASAVLAAGAALVVGGLFLHVWQGFSTALTFWAVAGLTLSHHAEDPAAVDADAAEAEPVGALAPT